MTKIYFIGDTHFGKTYPYKKNYELNLSDRSLDVVNNCEKIISTAIQDEADLIIFLGDLYERKAISPTIRRIVREKIFIPLNQNHIKTLIIGGNHDSIRNPRRGADIQELANFSNVEVYTKIKSQIFDINGIKLGIIFLPFIHFDVLVENFKEKNIVSPEFLKEKDNYIIAQTIFKRYIEQFCEEKLQDCDKRILVGHYYLDGAKIRETNNPSMIYGEFLFNREMVQKHYFDLVIFGHVHLKQTMWNNDRIIIPGSIDRIDMGERNSDKFYCTYVVETDDLQFHPIECRRLLKSEIIVPDDIEDLTQNILNNLPEKEEIRNSLCKLFISYPKGKEVKIDKNKIDNYFKDSYHTDFVYTEQASKGDHQLREVNLDPKSLFQDYLEQKHSSHKHYADMHKLGLDLIEKEISLVDLTAKGPLSIKSIDMQYFNKYGKGPNRLEFIDDLYVIKGPTGAGKSSILDAITFALFKRSTRKEAGLKLDEILYKSGYVNLELLIGNNTLSIRRGQRSPKLEIKLDNMPLFQGLSIPDKEKKLEDIIGYDYEGFISSFFIRQQELQIFSILTSGERQDRLIKLFKLKIFQDIHKKLKFTIGDFTRKHDNFEGQIKGLATIVEGLPQKEEELNQKNEEFKKKEEERYKLSKEVQKLKEETERLQLDAFKYSNTQQTIEELETDISKNENDLESYKTQQIEVIELKDRLINLPDYKKEKMQLENQKEVLEGKRYELQKVQSEISNHENLINQTEAQYNEQLENVSLQLKEKESRLLSLEADMTKDEAFRVLKEDGILTERINRLTNIEIPMAKEYDDLRRIKEFTSLEEQTKNELNLVRPKQEKITKDVFLVDELKVNQNELENQYRNIEKKKTEGVTQFKENINKLKLQLEKEGLTEDFDGLLKEIKVKLEKIAENEKSREDIEIKLREKKDFSLLIEKSEKDLSSLKDKLDGLNKQLKKLEPAYHQYLEVANEFGKKQKIYQELENMIEGMKVEIEYIQNDIRRIKETDNDIKEIKKEMKIIKENIEKYTLLRDDIFHANGVPKFAIEKILPAISIRASEILSDLTDGKFNQITFQPLQGTRVGFEINVFDGERKRDASSYSGGEKTQINAAIRFAIMERIAEIPDTAGAVFRKSNTLFIDEGDLGTLDDETARQRFIEKILELKSIFKNIILITHLEDVAEQFPNRIVIGWDTFGNSKIF